ncbi:MAG: hypothetical protein M1832_000731 [Thelocarpon impressellum]|nr:MAG: hypothetical protein M1832_000731 [Thelocarpon impressellum]
MAPSNPSKPPERPSQQEDGGDEEEEAMIDPAEVGEEVPSDPDEPMDSDGPDEGEGDQVIALQNDSVAHFDGHNDSIFCIAQHPVHPEIVATGGGDDVGYIFDATPPEAPVLPASYQTEPQVRERESLSPLHKLGGHMDSVNAVVFTLPRGEYALSAGLDGRLRAYHDTSRDGSGREWDFVAEAQEVEEINWLIACPHPAHPNTVALGANDGSVWVYRVDKADAAAPLTIVQAFYLHTQSCTTGAWTPDGKMLATVSEDGSFYAWDVFGEAAAAGLVAGQGTQSVVGLTSQDQRFAVEGGLFSVAVSPTSTFAVVGGAGGNIRAIGLPRIGPEPATTGRNGSSGKSTGGRRPASAQPTTGTGQAGQILASLRAQSDGIETLAFSPPPLTLLAAGSVDGSITLFDTAHRFAVRRHIREAHEDHAVVKVEFVKDDAERGNRAASTSGGWLLTSVGMDGVVRRWDTRGGTAAASQGAVGEWRGHRGDGEGGGVLGFVQGGGGARIVTAGDE